MMKPAKNRPLRVIASLAFIASPSSNKFDCAATFPADPLNENGATRSIATPDANSPGRTHSAGMFCPAHSSARHQTRRLERPGIFPNRQRVYITDQRSNRELVFSAPALVSIPAGLQLSPSRAVVVSWGSGSIRWAVKPLFDPASILKLAHI